MDFGQSVDIKKFIGEKAGMDETTIAGLREQLHSGLLPMENRLMKSCGMIL